MVSGRIIAAWAALAVALLSLSVGCAGAIASAAAPGVGHSLAAVPLAQLMPHMENHTDTAGPVFKGEYAPPPAGGANELIVVSYNLRYGEAVAEAIRAYREVRPLPAADIVLLQEMDEAGVGAIARELGYNYVYYPASVAEDGDNFGNAILARWPISDPAKLILPGLHPLTGQQRTATRAVVRVGDADVLVYSTHIEVATAPPSLREAQFAAILADVPKDAPRVIVGGDFNTITGRGVAALAAQYATEGLNHVSADLGPTFTRFGLRPSATDHLFARGFERRDAGVLRDITASDHFPVWAQLSRVR